MNFKLFLVFLISLNLHASSFKVGEGSQFVMKSGDQKIDLNIYVSESSFSNLGVEIHFGAGDLFITNMWQQFHFKIVDSGPLMITAGYIKTDQEAKSEIMTKELFQQNQGVEVQDFLFSKKEQIEKYHIADELVEVPAGSIMAKHYRKKSHGQVVDFWISDKVLPIGLVKLVSKSEKVKINNYSIELANLLKNVKPAIEPSQAIPLTQKTAKLLSKTKK